MDVGVAYLEAVAGGIDANHGLKGFSSKGHV
jgi:hypothetical protein